MKAKQYEIWIADLNPIKGAEPGKIRPVIIVQTDLLNKHHPSSIVCPLTTNVQKDSEILRVHIKKGCCGSCVPFFMMMERKSTLMKLKSYHYVSSPGNKQPKEYQ